MTTLILNDTLNPNDSPNGHDPLILIDTLNLNDPLISMIPVILNDTLNLNDPLILNDTFGLGGSFGFRGVIQI